MDKKIEQDIYDFLKYGLVDGKPIEMNLQDFIEKYVLQIKQSFSHDTVNGYYYGIFEVVFENQILTSIAINRSLLNKAIIKYDQKILRLNKRKLFSKITEALEALSIDWNFNQAYSFDRQLCISTEANVNLLFDFSSRDEYLDKIIK